MDALIHLNPFKNVTLVKHFPGSFAPRTTFNNLSMPHYLKKNVNTSQSPKSAITFLRLAISKTMSRIRGQDYYPNWCMGFANSKGCLTVQSVAKGL